MNSHIDKKAALSAKNADSKSVTGFTVECKVHFKNGHRNRKRLQQGKAPIPRPVVPGNIPRISRLMALAIRFEGLIISGEVQDYADLARLGFVSRARISQIMNMLNLAPDIQEDILFLPRIFKGKEPITEMDVRQIVAVTNWSLQREMWAKIKKLQLSKSI
jgi:hypothetical protein